MLRDVGGENNLVIHRDGRLPNFHLAVEESGAITIRFSSNKEDYPSRLDVQTTKDWEGQASGLFDGSQSMRDFLADADLLLKNFLNILPAGSANQTVWKFENENAQALAQIILNKSEFRLPISLVEQLSAVCPNSEKAIEHRLEVIKKQNIQLEAMIAHLEKGASEIFRHEEEEERKHHVITGSEERKEDSLQPSQKHSSLDKLREADQENQALLEKLQEHHQAIEAGIQSRNKFTQRIYQSLLSAITSLDEKLSRATRQVHPGRRVVEDLFKRSPSHLPAKDLLARCRNLNDLGKQVRTVVQNFNESRTLKEKVQQAINRLQSAIKNHSKAYEGGLFHRQRAGSVEMASQSPPKQEHAGRKVR